MACTVGIGQDAVHGQSHPTSSSRAAAAIPATSAEAVLRDPFQGLGKPEPLKHLGTGVWSRRLTQEHRLVYMVSADRIDFLQTPYHY